MEAREVEIQRVYDDLARELLHLYRREAQLHRQLQQLDYKLAREEKDK